MGLLRSYCSIAFGERERDGLRFAEREKGGRSSGKKRGHSALGGQQAAEEGPLEGVFSRRLKLESTAPNR